LIATSNAGKFREIMEVLGKLPVEFLSLADVGVRGDFQETGEAFEVNALGKARYYASKCGLITIAEDSGILVDALNDELGVKTRRWGAGEHASDEEWILHFLQRMEHVPEGKRGARFVCCAAVVDEKGKGSVFCGKTKGVITHKLEAPIYGGLPLSSCFRPKGKKKVYSALSTQEKNEVSHRGKAMKKVHDWILEKISRAVV